MEKSSSLATDQPQLLAVVNETLAEAFVELVEKKPENPTKWLGEWLLNRSQAKTLRSSSS